MGSGISGLVGAVHDRIPWARERNKKLLQRSMSGCYYEGDVAARLSGKTRCWGEVVGVSILLAFRIS